VAKKYKLKLG